MCEPITIGMGVSMMGSLMQAKAAEARGAAAQAAANTSARFSDQAAADAIARSPLGEMRVQMHGSSVVAAQRGALSGSAIDVNSGSGKDLQDNAKSMTEIDRQTVQRNAALEAYGLRARAGVQRQEGEYARRAGEDVAMGSFIGGIGKAVGLGGSVMADKMGGSDTGWDNPRVEE